MIYFNCKIYHYDLQFSYSPASIVSIPNESAITLMNIDPYLLRFGADKAVVQKVFNDIGLNKLGLRMGMTSAEINTWIETGQ
jgi:hypothetical protein